MGQRLHAHVKAVLGSYLTRHRVVRARSLDAAHEWTLRDEGRSLAEKPGNGVHPSDLGDSSRDIGGKMPARVAKAIPKDATKERP